MGKKRGNCIFISVNKSFLKILKLCLLSISKNYKNHPDIVICHTDLTLKDVKELMQITDKIMAFQNVLNTHEIWPIMSHLPNDIDPRVFYARFLIWRLPIFQKYTSVLHLDADTIVLKDCTDVFDKQEFYIEKETYVWNDALFIDHNDQLLLEQIYKDGLRLNNEIWNAGVFMIPGKYITASIYDELMQVLDQYKNYIKRADQSIINIRLQKKSIPISHHDIYNFQHRALMKARASFLLRHSIVHFNGVPDPYRVFFMKLLLLLPISFLWISLYKFFYILVIWTLNLSHKIRGKAVYNIY